jgi:hypothetical protein
MSSTEVFRYSETLGDLLERIIEVDTYKALRTAVQQGNPPDSALPGSAPTLTPNSLTDLQAQHLNTACSKHPAGLLTNRERRGRSYHLNRRISTDTPKNESWRGCRF